MRINQIGHFYLALTKPVKRVDKNREKFDNINVIEDKR